MPGCYHPVRMMCHRLRQGMLAVWGEAGDGPLRLPDPRWQRGVPIDFSKTVAAVTLPSLGDVAGYNLALHIFAMSIG